jgi:hypothetical protein
MNKTTNWLRETFEYGSNESMPVTDVYSMYLDFCQRSVISPESLTNFGRIMRMVFPMVTHGGSHKRKTYKNIKPISEYNLIKDIIHPDSITKMFDSESPLYANFAEVYQGFWTIMYDIVFSPIRVSKDPMGTAFRTLWSKSNCKKFSGLFMDPKFRELLNTIESRMLAQLSDNMMQNPTDFDTKTQIKTMRETATTFVTLTHTCIPEANQHFMLDRMTAAHEFAEVLLKRITFMMTIAVQPVLVFP